MLHEFALEPALIRNWDRFQYYMSNFGIQLGRMISRFPKKWEQLVIGGLADCGDVEKKKIVEALIRGRNRLFPRYHEWDPSLSWLANAELEHAKRPFHAVIAAANSNGRDFVLEESALDATYPPLLWSATTPRLIERSGLKMAEAIRILLQMSKTVLFIDRNFGPKDKGFRLGLQAFLLAMLNRHNQCQANRIEYHTGDLVHPADFKDLCNSYLPEIIPSGVRIRFVRWRHGELHDRYIVTEHGGASFAQGLDEAGETEQPDQLVALIDRALANQMLQNFTGRPPKFTLIDEDVVVIGKRNVVSTP